jgi:plasmid stabilization system protein ParE
VKYRYDSEARAEYRDAIHFYGKAAERFFHAVESTVQRIRNAPTQFRELEPGVRICRVPDFPYPIYYIIQAAEIIIVAVKSDRRILGTGVIEFHNIQNSSLCMFW